MTQEYLSLVRFLKERGAYEAYRKNSSHNPTFYVIQHARHEKPSKLLYASFPWQQAQEGVNYWHALYMLLKSIEDIVEDIQEEEELIEELMERRKHIYRKIQEDLDDTLQEAHSPRTNANVGCEIPFFMVLFFVFFLWMCGSNTKHSKVKRNTTVENVQHNKTTDSLYSWGNMDYQHHTWYNDSITSVK